MSYFTRYMDKCSRLHSFPVTRYKFFHAAMHLPFHSDIQGPANIPGVLLNIVVVHFGPGGREEQEPAAVLRCDHAIRSHLRVLGKGVDGGPRALVPAI